MRRLTTRILIGAVLLLIFAPKTDAQSVIDPSDPVIESDVSNAPPLPDYFHPIVKWVRTLKIANDAVRKRNNGWTGDTYKAYNYNGLTFRVRFPKSYDPTANDGKRYPMILFFHGQGENSNRFLGPPPPYGSGSNNFDNQFQLLQGPHEFDTAIIGGTYDGYVVVPQLQNDTLSPKTVFYENVLKGFKFIVDYMIANNKVDRFHIVLNGLSEGGVGIWDWMKLYPTYTAAALPMSSPDDFINWGNPTGTYFKDKRYTPIWTTQGGKDTHPWPYETQRIKDTMDKWGANFRVSYYPNNGHDTWYRMWGESDFWPYVNRAYSSNPWPLFGKSHFWPGEPINTTIGITPGFDNYEWRRNGQLIVGSNTNELHVTGTGVYDARVMTDGVWSDWSHVPVTITGDNYRIEAEDWVAMSGAQTEVTDDVDGNLNVGWLGNGDWMDYTISPYVSGTYRLDLRLASYANNGSPGKLEIRNSDSTVLGVVDIPATGGWQNWQTVPVFIHLPGGTQNIRVKVVTGSSNDVVNFNWLTFYLASADASLPVKFVYFNTECNNGAVTVRWKTAQEQNSSSFTVQRTTDGNSWTDIGSLPAAGQSGTERSYVFVDRSASGSAYYRVVEQDVDGRTSVTSTVRSICGGSTELSIYPNPTSGNSSLNIMLDQPTNLALRILDTKGAVMEQKQLQLPAGSTIISLNMSNWPEGVYTINAQYNGQLKTMKIIKQ